MTYRITHGLLVMNLPISFKRQLWKELLTILLPPKKERLKAEVRYLYEGGDTWPEEGIWAETSSPNIVIEESCVQHLRVWRYAGVDLRTLGGTPLPNKFTLDIQIKRVSDNKLREHFKIEYEH